MIENQGKQKDCPVGPLDMIPLYGDYRILRKMGDLERATDAIAVKYMALMDLALIVSGIYYVGYLIQEYALK